MPVVRNVCLPGRWGSRITLTAFRTFKPSQTSRWLAEWLADPEVERVVTTTAGASRQAAFVVYLKQRRIGADEEEDV